MNMSTATFRKTLLRIAEINVCINQRKKGLPVGAILFYNNNNNNNNDNNNTTSIIYTRHSPCIDIKLGQEWIKSTIRDK